jgi:hypothetical protein
MVVLVASGCTREEGRPPRAREAVVQIEHLQDGLSTLDVTRVVNGVQAHADSTDRKLREVAGLTRRERQILLRDVNAVQTARARRVGITRGSPLEKLVNSGQLVQLEDTARYWVVRKLDYSEPYVTPATRALLTEIGRRFQQRLDSLGVPRYRIEITSVLRTAEDQSALRKRNANAAREVSAHEFGTTVDIAYRRYGPPVQDTVAGVPLNSELRAWTDSIMCETARQRGAELQAILGRVLAELRAQGRVLVRMERRQTVYHITATGAAPARRT